MKLNDKFFQVKEYLRYLSEAKSRYYIHSPFVFSFINEVMRDERHFYAYDEVETLRENLRKSKKEIDVTDFGAGSQHISSSQRKISSIAKSSAAPEKYAQLLFRIVQHFEFKKILELGISLGITTSYLSAYSHEAKVFSIEGSASVAEVAVNNFTTLGRNNIQLTIGTFEEKLPDVLNQMKEIDFLFLDGNHRLVPTLSYFNLCAPLLHEKSIVVIDDIYWSSEMKQAWNELKNHSSVTLSIDLYRMGILFSRKDREKEHFRLYF